MDHHLKFDAPCYYHLQRYVRYVKPILSNSLPNIISIDVFFEKREERNPCPRFHSFSLIVIIAQIKTLDINALYPYC